MLIATGDTHGYLSISKLLQLDFALLCQGLCKDDFVIIAGDAGVHNKDDLLEWLSKKPWTTLYVPGNHEPWDVLDGLERVSWHGGHVGIDTRFPDVKVLLRGEIYEDVAGIRLFAFGGADSIDKEQKKRLGAWSPRELPSPEELVYARERLACLADEGKKIDLVVTHTPPTGVIDEICRKRGISGAGRHDCLLEFLDELHGGEICEWGSWIAGHMHIDEEFGDVWVLFDEFVQIDRGGSLRWLAEPALAAIGEQATLAERVEPACESMLSGCPAGWRNTLLGLWFSCKELTDDAGGEMPAITWTDRNGGLRVDVACIPSLPEQTLCALERLLRKAEAEVDGYCKMCGEALSHDAEPTTRGGKGAFLCRRAACIESWLGQSAS